MASAGALGAAKADSGRLLKAQPGARFERVEETGILCLH